MSFVPVTTRWCKVYHFLTACLRSPGSRLFHIGSQISLGVLALRCSSKPVLILHNEHGTVIDSEVVSGGSVMHSQGAAFSLGRNLKLMDHNLIPPFSCHLSTFQIFCLSFIGK